MHWHECQAPLIPIAANMTISYHFMLFIFPDFLQLTFTQQNKKLILKKLQGRELFHQFSCTNYISSH
jgi:hypothetical protein